MSYQVIARKYRPQRFSDVVGQDHVTRTLSQAIEQKRIAHAYLFCGPRGTGKTTIARIFAKCLNCTGGPKVDFDDSDPRCREIAEGRSLDVLEIDAASNRGIDEIRGLRETVKYAPASSKFKVYIIDEVHMLTKEAFNALLKTLEEPPEHVKFMFATTEPEKVLATILSRCQRFDLRRIPAALIVRHLGFISGQEKVSIDEQALFAIARGAEGCMRDAESTLDQLISFCGATIQEADVLSMFGLTSQSQVMELSRAILAGDVEMVLREFNGLAASGKDLSRLVSDLLNHFRNVLIFQVSRGDLTLLEVSESETTTLTAQASIVSTTGLTQILEVLGDAEIRLRDAASKKILIEVALLNAVEARQAIRIDSVLARLESLKASNGTAGAPSPSEKSATAVRAPSSEGSGCKEAGRHEVPPSVAAQALREESPPTPASTLRQGPTTNDLNQLWAQLVAAVGQISPFTRTYLLQAHPVALSGSMLTIGFAPDEEDHLGLVDNKRNHALLAEKLTELGYPNLLIKFVKAGRPATFAPAPEAPAAAPVSVQPPALKPTAPIVATRPAPVLAPREKPVFTPLNKEDFKNDPLIQKALEVFKGQIVDARSTANGK